MDFALYYIENRRTLLFPKESPDISLSETSRETQACQVPQSEEKHRMRFAIFSDIHANLEALQEVLKKCIELSIDAYLCLGDTVGYNANPHECLEIVRSLPLMA